MKEKAVTAMTAATLTTSMVVPDVAQAASGVTPSVKKFNVLFFSSLPVIPYV